MIWCHPFVVTELFRLTFAPPYVTRSRRSMVTVSADRVGMSS